MTAIDIDLLDGKERRLRYDFNAVADIESKAGEGIGTLLDKSFAAARVLIWGGLRWEDRSLSLERTGLMLQQYVEKGGSVGLLSSKINDALMASGVFKHSEDSKEGNEQTEAELKPTSV